MLIWSWTSSAAKPRRGPGAFHSRTHDRSSLLRAVRPPRRCDEPVVMIG